jgi:L-cysteine:1D-myo-inositol 2-amino-2-deoxy-alpha-D-glucopyranoside ligase
MRAWPSPSVPDVSGDGLGPAPELALFDARNGVVRPTQPGAVARLYVCGITPYDATHLGHLATCSTFDLVIRAWRAAGHRVRYVQNVTDVDDPLLERARETGEDWASLAERETELFREDMAAHSVIPPDVFAGAVESIPVIVELIAQLVARGAVYDVDGDLYYSVSADPGFAAVSNLSREEMLPLFAEHGGDPDRPGKRDPLDPLVWKRQRDGDPGWDSPFGKGRPGWHVECSAIARTHLGPAFDLQGGGSDLVFPHHEMSAGHAQAVDPEHVFAHRYAHQGMVGFEGHKMSKSRGNLVLVSSLRAAGVDPRTIRLALHSHHYRSDWEWTDSWLDDAAKRLARWVDAVAVDSDGADETRAAARELRAALADDLDTPRALEIVDEWAKRSSVGGLTGLPVGGDAHEAGPGRRTSSIMADVVQASLGIELG